MTNLYKYLFLLTGAIGASSGAFSFIKLADNPASGEFAELVSAISAALNILAIIWFTAKKSGKEIKKLETESESEFVQATHDSLEGAKISSAMLKERIDELKQDLENERRERQEDRIYFARRIKEIEVEARDNRLWAARLAKQVIETGRIPVPFISSTETDPLLSTINKEMDELEKTKGVREEELKNAKSDTKVP